MSRMAKICIVLAALAVVTAILQVGSVKRLYAYYRYTHSSYPHIPRSHRVPPDSAAGSSRAEAADIVTNMLESGSRQRPTADTLSALLLKYPDNNYLLAAFILDLRSDQLLDPAIPSRLADRLLKYEPDNAVSWYVKAAALTVPLSEPNNCQAALSAIAMANSLAIQPYLRAYADSIQQLLADASTQPCNNCWRFRSETEQAASVIISWLATNSRAAFADGDTAQATQYLRALAATRRHLLQTSDPQVRPDNISSVLVRNTPGILLADLPADQRAALRDQLASDLAIVLKSRGMLESFAAPSRWHDRLFTMTIAMAIFAAVTAIVLALTFCYATRKSSPAPGSPWPAFLQLPLGILLLMAAVILIRIQPASSGRSWYVDLTPSAHSGWSPSEFLDDLPVMMPLGLSSFLDFSPFAEPDPTALAFMLITLGAWLATWVFSLLPPRPQLLAHWQWKLPPAILLSIGIVYAIIPTSPSLAVKAALTALALAIVALCYLFWWLARRLPNARIRNSKAMQLLFVTFFMAGLSACFYELWLQAVIISVGYLAIVITIVSNPSPSCPPLVGGILSLAGGNDVSRNIARRARFCLAPWTLLFCLLALTFQHATLSAFSRTVEVENARHSPDTYAGLLAPDPQLTARLIAEVPEYMSDLSFSRRTSPSTRLSIMTLPDDQSTFIALTHMDLVTASRYVPRLGVFGSNRSSRPYLASMPAELTKDLIAIFDDANNIECLYYRARIGDAAAKATLQRILAESKAAAAAGTISTPTYPNGPVHGLNALAALSLYEHDDAATAAMLTDYISSTPRLSYEMLNLVSLRMASMPRSQALALARMLLVKRDYTDVLSSNRSLVPGPAEDVGDANISNELLSRAIKAAATHSTQYASGYNVWNLSNVGRFVASHLDASSVPLLKEALDTDDDNIRAFAVWNLRRLGYSFSAEETHTILATECGCTRRNAVVALPPDSAAPLLQDRDQTTRAIAYYLLER